MCREFSSFLIGVKALVYFSRFLIVLKLTLCLALKSYTIFSLLPKDLNGLVIIEKPLEVPLPASKPINTKLHAVVIVGVAFLPPCITIPNGQ